MAGNEATLMSAAFFDYIGHIATAAQAEPAAQQRIIATGNRIAAIHEAYAKAAENEAQLAEAHDKLQDVLKARPLPRLHLCAVVWQESRVCMPRASCRASSSHLCVFVCFCESIVQAGCCRWEAVRGLLDTRGRMSSAQASQRPPALHPSAHLRHPAPHLEQAPDRTR